MKSLTTYLQKNYFQFLLVLSLIVITQSIVLTFGKRAATSPKTTPSQEETIPRDNRPPIKLAVEGGSYRQTADPIVLKILPEGNFSVLTYRFEVRFDPKILTVQEVKFGNYFQEPQILRNEIDNKNGIVYFSAGLTPTEKARIGVPKNQNPFASLVFKVKSTRRSENVTTTVALGEKSVLFGQGAEINNLHQVLQPLNIILTANVEK